MTTSGKGEPERVAARGSAKVRRAFGLSANVSYLNHGSFGACLRSVTREQAAIVRRIEENPMAFYVRTYPRLVDEVRTVVSDWLDADPDGLVFVRNATEGVSTILAATLLEPGDEIVVTNHTYGACLNAVRRAAMRASAEVILVDVPLPIETPSAYADAIDAAISPRTRLVLVDHVTSPTALVVPVADIIRRCRARAIPVLVDGAHAPGMLEISLRGIGADFYVGNLHKWVGAPKGAAFVYLDASHREGFHPLVTSHGMTSVLRDRSRLHEEFDWVGTVDPSSLLCVPLAIRAMEALGVGTWPRIRAANQEAARRAREVLASRLGTRLLCPDVMIGAMAAVELPERVVPAFAEGGMGPGTREDPLSAWLAHEKGIEVPVARWAGHGRRLLRVSAHVYNHHTEYERLADSLLEGA